MSEQRKGDWILTYLGLQFWPIDPRPEEVSINDIAHALSNICRYAGHTKHFYSVAEHCALMFEAVRLAGGDLTAQRWALMHDAPEAYLVDIPKPLKKSLPDYQVVEERVHAAVAKRFGLPEEIPAIVHDFDRRICLDEREQAMTPSPHDWGLKGEPIGVTLQFLTPAKASEKFIEAYLELFVFREAA